MLLKGGVATPSTPPLDPPLTLDLKLWTTKWGGRTCIFPTTHPSRNFSLSFQCRLSISRRKILTSVVKCRLAYGWSAGNLNRPIRIQQAGKILVS